MVRILSTGKMLAGMFGAAGLCLALSSGVRGAEPPPAVAVRKMPAFRVDAADFDASEADIRAVCDSAGRQLWQYFPDYKLEPLVVCRGRQGPITLFDRNDRQEIVLRLDTSGTYWSQYSYQFAHEFCHVLAGFRAGENDNKWFEETLCETASLFVMRAMAKSWQSEPPYKHWADYRDNLRTYADDVMRARDLSVIHRQGLAAFYRQYATRLQRSATERELNGAMSVVLLHVLEAQPERWEAIRWLNSSPAGAEPEKKKDAPAATESDAKSAAATPADAGQTDAAVKSFAVYLARWHAAVPQRHRAFVRQIGKLYGIEVAAAEPQESK